MSEWKRYKLGDLLRVKHGWAFKGEFFSETGIQSILTPGNFYESGGFKANTSKDRFYIGEYPKEYLCSKGDLIVAMTEQAAGLLGSTAIVPEDNRYLHNQRIGLISCNEYLNKDFAYYLFMTQTVRQQISRSASGTKVKHTSPEKIYEVQVYIPKIQTQRNITKILTTLDQKIQINNQINQELEAMAKTLYDYWFVQFDFPDQNGKPYKSSGGKMVYHPELKREIPEGWGVESVGNLLDKVTKAEKIENNSIEFIGEIPVIDQSQKYIAGFTNNENGLIQPQNGHVIFGDHTRVVKYINFDYARGADGTQVLISKNENISNVLLYHMIEDFDLSNYGYARHFKFLKEKIVIVPNKEVSSKFETQANVIYEKIKNNIFEIQELTQLRDWLLPMLMNGQVKVE
jgi:type I restriction modification DNA specificity domain protein